MTRPPVARHPGDLPTQHGGDVPTRRIVGVDLARGLAVLGMFVAHAGHTDRDFSLARADSLEGWLALAHGRSSVLFALLAGVSLSLVWRRPATDPAEPARVTALRRRAGLLLRSALLLALVALLQLLHTPVALILGCYAAFFVLALPFLDWSPRRLFTAAGVVALTGGPVLLFGSAWLWELDLDPEAGRGTGAVTDFLLMGSYPAVVWMAFVLAGMGVGALDLRSMPVRLQLLNIGALLAALGYGGSRLATALAGPRAAALQTEVPTRALASQGEPAEPLLLLGAGPHSGTPFEVLGSGGVALAVLALCLLAPTALRVVLAPVVAVGTMALTVYSAHIVALWAWDGSLQYPATNVPLLWLTLATLLAAWLWHRLAGRGPLERLMHAVTSRGAPS